MMTSDNKWGGSPMRLKSSSDGLDMMMTNWFLYVFMYECIFVHAQAMNNWLYDDTAGLTTLEYYRGTKRARFRLSRTGSRFVQYVFNDFSTGNNSQHQLFYIIDWWISLSSKLSHFRTSAPGILAVCGRMNNRLVVKLTGCIHHHHLYHRHYHIYI